MVALCPPQVRMEVLTSKEVIEESSEGHPAVARGKEGVPEQNGLSMLSMYGGPGLGHP